MFFPIDEDDVGAVTGKIISGFVVVVLLTLFLVSLAFRSGELSGSCEADFTAWDFSVTSDIFDAAEIIDDASCVCDSTLVGVFLIGDGDCEVDLDTGEDPTVDDTEAALRINP